MPGPLKVDLFSQYVRWLARDGIDLVLMSLQLAPDVQVPEYLGTLLLAVAGLMIVASARELVLLFVGLELISIPTYVLLYLGRRTMESQEAHGQVFLSEHLVLGHHFVRLQLLVRHRAFDRIVHIQEALSGLDETTGMLWFARLSLVLIFAGLCFKVTAVPFHFYAPDVYRDTRPRTRRCCQFCRRSLAWSCSLRIVAIAMPGFETYAWHIALVLALLTNDAGEFVVALWQDNVRRLLAYSSIAHGGYMLVGFWPWPLPRAAERTRPRAVGWHRRHALLCHGLRLGDGRSVCHDHVPGGVMIGRSENVDELAVRGPPPLSLGRHLDGHLYVQPNGHPAAGRLLGQVESVCRHLSVRPPNADAAGTPREWFLILAVIGVLNAAISAGYYLHIWWPRCTFRNSSRKLKHKPPGARARPCSCAAGLGRAYRVAAQPGAGRHKCRGPVGPAARDAVCGTSG